LDAGHCLHALWKHQLGTGPGNVKKVEYPMTIHTLVLSLSPDMTVQDREKFFAEMESVMLNGGARKFEHRPHLPLPADDHAPVFKATDVVQISFADLDAVAAAFALPALREFMGTWQGRFPYKVVWVNHEPAL
jgi:hypothetical protein